MYRVKDPVFAMAESSFLDGGSRLDDVVLNPLTTFSGGRSVAAPGATLPDVGRCRSDGVHLVGHGLDRLRNSVALRLVAFSCSPRGRADGHEHVQLCTGLRIERQQTIFRRIAASQVNDSEVGVSLWISRLRSLPGANGLLKHRRLADECFAVPHRHLKGD
jgi:hypothetical protein